jgi:hypothetical protein
MWRTVGNNTQTRFDSKNYSRDVGDLDWFQPFPPLDFSPPGIAADRNMKSIRAYDAGQRRQAPGPISSKPAV